LTNYEIKSIIGLVSFFYESQRKTFIRKFFCLVSTLGSMSYIYHSGYGYSTRLCKSVASWFINKYYPRHKITLDIIHRGMKREGCVGYCDTTGGWFRPRNFEIEIDTHLDKETYIKTLLHEMFHMKQFIDGSLKTKWSKNTTRMNQKRKKLLS